MCKNEKSKNKVDIKDNLETERLDVAKYKQGFDFVPRIDHWTSIDEQKLKVEEIEKKTKK